MTYGLPDSMLVGMAKRTARGFKGTPKRRNVDTTLPITTRIIEGLFRKLADKLVKMSEPQDPKEKVRFKEAGE